MDFMINKVWHPNILFVDTNDFAYGQERGLSMLEIPPSTAIPQKQLQRGSTRTTGNGRGGGHYHRTENTVKIRKGPCPCGKKRRILAFTSKPLILLSNTKVFYYLFG